MQAKEDEGGEFASMLTERMRLHSIHLDVISIDNPEEDSKWASAKAANQEALSRIFQNVIHTVKRVQGKVELLGAFRFKEYAHSAYYAGPMTIGNLMTIPVKVCANSSGCCPSAKATNSRSAVMTEDAGCIILLKILLLRKAACKNH